MAAHFIGAAMATNLDVDTAALAELVQLVDSRVSVRPWMRPCARQSPGVCRSEASRHWARLSSCRWSSPARIAAIRSAMARHHTAVPVMVGCCLMLMCSSAPSIVKCPMAAWARLLSEAMKERRLVLTDGVRLGLLMQVREQRACDRLAMILRGFPYPKMPANWHHEAVHKVMDLRHRAPLICAPSGAVGAAEHCGGMIWSQLPSWRDWAGFTAPWCETIEETVA